MRLSWNELGAGEVAVSLSGPLLLLGHVTRLKKPGHAGMCCATVDT
jgi:hypothetical protein